MTNSDKKCGPVVIMLDIGQTVDWCTRCGVVTAASECRHEWQPFVAPTEGYYWLCKCGLSGNGAICDGAHKG